MEELINHTDEDVELPLIDEESESTSDDTEQESVDTFESDLESAETDEDFAKLGEAARGEVEESTEDTQDEKPSNEVSEETIDTETDEDETTFNIGKGFAIKDGDIELNITDEAKLRQLAQMGLNYGSKTTELAKHRSFVKYAEENNISLEDIQILKDIKSGNKDAYSSLAKASGIDVYDVNSEHSYNPEPIDIPQVIDPMVDSIANEILANKEYTEQFKRWVNDDRMPPEVVKEIYNNPNAIKAVYDDINAGVFDKAMHQAYSDVKVNGAEFNSAYLRAKEMLTAIKPEAPKKPKVTRGDRVRASSKRGHASATSKTYGTISDMNDDDFLANFNDIIANLERPQ